jgi:hypothetical protein
MSKVWLLPNDEPLSASNTESKFYAYMSMVDSGFKSLSWQLLQLPTGVVEIKDKVRKSDHEIVTLFSAVRHDQSEIASLSQSTIEKSIKELKAYAYRHNYELQTSLDQIDECEREKETCHCAS